VDRNRCRLTIIPTAIGLYPQTSMLAYTSGLNTEITIDYGELEDARGSAPRAPFTCRDDLVPHARLDFERPQADRGLAARAISRSAPR